MSESEIHTQLHSSEFHLNEDIELPAALLILNGEMEGCVIDLNRNLMTGGRLPENEIYLPDSKLSRRHFQIIYDRTSYYLRDVRSTNGTYLNERRLSADSVLINGDIIGVGQTRIKFISGDDPERAELGRSVQDSSIDALTGCYSMEYFSTQLDRAFKAAVLENVPLSLLLFSIDTAESVDKAFGYQAVNFMLRKSMERIKERGIRESDVLARYSDYEFILLLEGVSVMKAKRIAERLLELFDNKPIPYRDDSLKPTLSIGVAETKPEMRNAAELFKQADRGLFESKKHGGNQCTIFGASTFDPIDEETDQESFE